MSGYNENLTPRQKSVILVHKVLTRFQLMQRYGNGERCNHCGKRVPLGELTIDHIIPLVDYGHDTQDNMQLLCVKCHRKKTNCENINRQSHSIDQQKQLMKAVMVWQRVEKKYEQENQ